ncbi:MAG: hypothetical protein LBK27_07955 [Treponema sp.]|nr:hypothetical protein [Treponema sp.]
MPDLLTKLKKTGAALGDFFRALPGRFSSLPARIREAGAVSGGLLRGKRKWLLIGLGAAVVLLFFSLAAIFAAVNRNPGAGPLPAGELTGPVQDNRIPPEELFLPDEPDFIPGVLLERERRETWTAGDAAPYWQDPLKNGEEPWREQAELIIDELLERVP